MDRRAFLRLSTLGSSSLALGLSGFWRSVYAAAPIRSPMGPYGALAAVPDASGLRLPHGFTSRILARSTEPVPGTRYPWHPAPDGGACFPLKDGGWVYTSNSEATPDGGVSALRFDKKARVVDAYRILQGTRLNCAGGPTPWGTWLSCEEFDQGRVWECDPTQAGQGQARPALGAFAHEAVAVDPVGQRLYLTEDRPDGRLYRFTPAKWPSLEAGTLEAAHVTGDVFQGALVDWVPVSCEAPASAQSVAERTTVFLGGEGCWYSGGTVYFTTKHDTRVWAHTPATGRLEVLYDGARYPGAPLVGVDNVTMSRGHELFVCEDHQDMNLCVLTADRKVSSFLHVVGHDGSELTGVALSPDGRRLYVSSQRGTDGRGVTFEVTGPFHTA